MTGNSFVITRHAQSDRRGSGERSNRLLAGQKDSVVIESAGEAVRRLSKLTKVVRVGLTQRRGAMTKTTGFGYRTFRLGDLHPP